MVAISFIKVYISHGISRFKITNDQPEQEPASGVEVWLPLTWWWNTATCGACSGFCEGYSAPALLQRYFFVRVVHRVLKSISGYYLVSINTTLKDIFSALHGIGLVPGSSRKISISNLDLILVWFAPWTYFGFSPVVIAHFVVASTGLIYSKLCCY
jgi:hypothetical protein